MNQQEFAEPEHNDGAQQREVAYYRELAGRRPEDTSWEEAGALQSLDKQKLHPRQEARKKLPWLVPVLVAAAFLGTGALFACLAPGISNLSSQSHSVDSLFEQDKSGTNACDHACPVTHTFQVNGQAHIIVHDSLGEVRVYGETSGAVNIRTAGPFSADGTTVQAPQLSQNGNTITVTGNTAASDRGNGIAIEVPANTIVDVQDDQGRVLIDGVKGQINAHMQQGSIRLHDVEGTVNAHVDSGRIMAYNVTLRDQSQFSTGDGVIDFAGSFAANGHYQFSSDSGAINLNLPVDQAMLIHAQSTTGAVNNEFAGNSDSTGAAANITTSSNSGDITISKAE